MDRGGRFQKLAGPLVSFCLSHGRALKWAPERIQLSVWRRLLCEATGTAQHTAVPREACVHSVALGAALCPSWRSSQVWAGDLEASAQPTRGQLLLSLEQDLKRARVCHREGFSRPRWPLWEYGVGLVGTARRPPASAVDFAELGGAGWGGGCGRLLLCGAWFPPPRPGSVLGETASSAGSSPGACACLSSNQVQPGLQAGERLHLHWALCPPRSPQ